MGAGDIYVCATHGIFSRNAVQRLEEAPIAECIYNVFMSRPVSGIFGGNSTI